MEIKIRVWDVKMKHMIYPPNHHFEVSLTGNVFNLQNGEGGEDCYIPMFWTGQKDKNDKEIYEGDKIRVDGDEEYEIKYNKKMIRFEADGFWHGHHDDPANFLEDLDDTEVIGNIHENPEFKEKP